MQKGERVIYFPPVRSGSYWKRYALRRGIVTRGPCHLGFVNVRWDGVKQSAVTDADDLITESGLRARIAAEIQRGHIEW